MTVDRKRVSFTYDSELQKVTTTWFGNMAVKNNGESALQEPTLEVLEHNGIVLEAAKECLEEMLAFVNTAIENN